MRVTVAAGGTVDVSLAAMSAVVLQTGVQP
jgi:hypothetical protein